MIIDDQTPQEFVVSHTLQWVLVPSRDLGALTAVADRMGYITLTDVSMSKSRTRVSFRPRRST